MEAIVFGTGLIGKKSLPYLEEKYHIKSIVDNNQTLWGTRFGSYMIEEPEKVIDGSIDIIITSKKNSTEITEQLLRMGVKEEKIYICYKYNSLSGEKYGIYSIIEDNVKSTEKLLIQYDLLNAEEQKLDKTSVLIFCSVFSSYAKQLIENMSQRVNDITFSLLTNAYESVELIHADNLEHIYCYETIEDLRTILEKIPIYDVMQLLWIEHEWVYFADLIRRKTRKLNLKVGGSDFYRASVAEREYKRTLINYADIITADTECTVNNFKTYYKDSAKDKMDILPYGIEVLEYIDKKRNIDKEIIRKKFHIPSNKFVVTCGHNAEKAHQHLRIVEALIKLPDYIKEKIICIFPMTYGGQDIKYEENILTILKENGLQSVILKDYMNFEDMAEYALISDIMIHVQTTDQLSSTMLEEMYAESIVIAGKWLPYKNLHEDGIFFIDVNEISEITEVIDDVVNHIDYYKERCKDNIEIVWERSSWDRLAERWHNIWK